jgi:hypothetical protein
MPLTVDVEVPPLDREVLALWVRSPSIRATMPSTSTMPVGEPESASLMRVVSASGRPREWADQLAQIA